MMSEHSYKEIPQVEIRLKVNEGHSLYVEDQMNSPEKVVLAMADMMADLDREYVMVLNLNSQNQAICWNIVSIGSINSAEVSVSNIFKSAILSNAAGVLAFHNHPSGSLTPSREDIAVTKRLIQAGDLLGIPVLDHIIVAGYSGEYYSMRENKPGNLVFREETQVYEVHEAMSDRLVNPQKAGETIRMLREQAEMDITQLAELSMLSVPDMVEIESGKKLPEGMPLYLMASALNVYPGSLLKGEPASRRSDQEFMDIFERIASSLDEIAACSKEYLAIADRVISENPEVGKEVASWYENAKMEHLSKFRTEKEEHTVTETSKEVMDCNRKKLAISVSVTHL